MPLDGFRLVPAENRGKGYLVAPKREVFVSESKDGKRRAHMRRIPARAGNATPAGSRVPLSTPQLGQLPPAAPQQGLPTHTEAMWEHWRQATKSPRTAASSPPQEPPPPPPPPGDSWGSGGKRTNPGDGNKNTARYGENSKRAPLTKLTAVALEDMLKNRHSGLQDVYLSVRTGGAGNAWLSVSSLVVEEDARGSGVGSRVMEDIVALADANGWEVSLTPESGVGGKPPSKKDTARLRAWYATYGFVNNSGRNKDYEKSDTMWRKPRG